MEAPKELWAVLTGELWSEICLIGISHGDFPEILPAGDGDLLRPEKDAFFQRKPRFQPEAAWSDGGSIRLDGQVEGGHRKISGACGMRSDSSTQVPGY